MLTELEWGALRSALLPHFEEDIVQQTLLDLLEMQSKGTKVLKPLHWCRRRAKSRTIDEYRQRDVEKAGKETLSVLQIPLDNRSTKDVARDKKRRQRRKTA